MTADGAPDIAALRALLPSRDVPLGQASTVRIIAASLEPPALFDDIAAGVDAAALARAAALTSPERLAQLGQLHLVPPADYAYGPGAGWAMTAFTHPARASRFTSGAYGVWYAAWTLETAVAETVYHTSNWMRQFEEPPQPVFKQVLEADLAGMFRELRTVPAPLYDVVHDPADYGAGQAVGRQLRDAGSDGVIYRSVRMPGPVDDATHSCAALFRPRVVRNARRVARITYLWDGTQVSPGPAVPVTGEVRR